MENRKPSIEEIFKNGVTVDYDLYKSDYVNIKGGHVYENTYNIYDKYSSELNNIREFTSINKNVPEEYLRLFLGKIANIKMYDIEKFVPWNQTYIKTLIGTIKHVIKHGHGTASVSPTYARILLVSTDMYFKLIKLLDDYNVDISKPIIIRQQLLEYNSVVIGKPMIIDQSTEIHSEIVKFLESNNDVDMNKPIIIQQLLREDNNTFIGKPMIIDHKQLQDEEKARSFTSHLSELLGIEKNENGQADFQEIEKRINLLLEKERHYMKIVEYMKDYRENIENF